MNKKHILENRPLKIGKLARVTGVRQSTIKFFSEIGILPFEQKERRLVRRYDRDEAIKRLKEIQELKRKGMSIEKIIGHYRNKIG